MQAEVVVLDGVLQPLPRDADTSCASWHSSDAGPDVVNASPPVSVLCPTYSGCPSAVPLECHPVSSSVSAPLLFCSGTRSSLVALTDPRTALVPFSFGL